MNVKSYLFIASAILLFSCRREFISPSSVNSSQLLLASAQAAESTAPTISLHEQQYTENISEEKQKDTIDRKKSGRKVKSNHNSLSQETAPAQEEQPKLDEKKGTKKEVDPRKSRGLLMTIFGGAATTLGIVLKNVAPTGLFIFAFGIVFVIGVITLILYWANPKPKM